MTAPTRAQYKDFLGHELFAGLAPLYLRQIASWTSFLVGNYQLQNFAKWYTNSSEITFCQMGLIGATIGLINTAVTMPFDYFKC